MLSGSYCKGCTALHPSVMYAKVNNVHKTDVCTTVPRNKSKKCNQNIAGETSLAMFTWKTKKDIRR